MKKSAVQLVPKWILEKYIRLYFTFGLKMFTFEQAYTTLKKLGCDKTKTSLVLSKLRKASWIETRMATEDARKHEYLLKDIKDLFKEYDTQKKQ